MITDESSWMKDITEEYPIHFSETLSVTGQAYKYDRRFYGRMHNIPLDKIKELHGCREANGIEQALIEHIGEEYWHHIYRNSKQN